MGKDVILRNGQRKTRDLAKRRIPELGYYYIVTDAKETEQNYFLGLRDLLPDNVRNRLVIKVRQSTITKMVDEALSSVNLYEQYAMPWVVFDRDQVVDFDEIINHARDKKVNVGWSNPCIEIWFHAYLGAMPVCDNSIKCVDNFEKIYKKCTKKKYQKNNINIYAELCKHGDEAQAIKIAKARLLQHQSECKLKESDMYPGTGLHVLVDEIKGKCVKGYVELTLHTHNIKLNK